MTRGGTFGPSWQTTARPVVDIVLSGPATARIGETIAIDVWAWSDTPTTFAGTQVWLSWPAELLGYVELLPGARDPIYVGFVPDGLGLNDDLTDGNGISVSGGTTSRPPDAPLLMGTLVFDVLGGGSATITCDDPLTLVASYGGVDITGTRGGATIAIESPLAVPEMGTAAGLLVAIALIALGRSRLG